MKTYIVIPAYNEGRKIGEVVDSIKREGFKHVIVVDDGSDDNTYEEAKKHNAVALRHKINRGKGAAAKTGIEAAKTFHPDIIVTMDGDGQHNPKDISPLITPLLQKKCDVVLGTRSYKADQMPAYKTWHNQIANAVTWIFSGLWVSDSQSGFRAFSKEAFSVINTRADTYEYESEVIREMARYKLSYAEVPIEVRYTEYSMGKAHKQSILNGIKTVYKMIWSKLT